MLFSNRNEFLCDSNRIEPIPPNIRNDIVSESGMTRRSSRLEKKIMKPHESPRITKKSIRGDSRDSVISQREGIRIQEWDRLKGRDHNSCFSQVKPISSCQQAKYDRTISLKAATEGAPPYPHGVSG